MSSGRYQGSVSAGTRMDSVFAGSQFPDCDVLNQEECSCPPHMSAQVCLLHCPPHMSAWVCNVHCHFQMSARVCKVQCPHSMSHCPRCSCSGCPAQWRPWWRNGARSHDEDGQSGSLRGRQRMRTLPRIPPWKSSLGQGSSEVLGLILTSPSSEFLLASPDPFLVWRHTYVAKINVKAHPTIIM